MPSSYLERQLRTYEDAARDRGERATAEASDAEAEPPDVGAFDFCWVGTELEFRPNPTMSRLAHGELILRADDILAGDSWLALPAAGLVDPPMTAAQAMLPIYVSFTPPDFDLIALLIQPVQPA